MLVFFEGNGRNCEVSNHWFSDCLSRGSAKFWPVKKESVPKTTGTPDCSVYWPVSSQPPATASAIFGIEPPKCFPRPTGISQIGATDKWYGRSSPPTFCCTLTPPL